MLTKNVLLKILNQIPPGLFNESPSEIKKYFKSAYPENSDEENNLLTAHFILSQLNKYFYSDCKWLRVKLHLVDKYKELRLSHHLNRKEPQHELWPYLEIIYCGNENNKIVTGIF